MEMSRQEAFEFLKGKKTLPLSDIHSQRIQEKLFEFGFKRQGEFIKISCTNWPYFLIKDSGYFRMTSSMEDLKGECYKLILPFEILNIAIKEEDSKIREPELIVCFDKTYVRYPRIISGTTNKNGGTEMKIMTKEEAYNFLKGKKTMVINEEQSKEVQQKLFDLGFRWASGSVEVENTDALFLFTDDEEGIITLSYTARTFDDSEKEFILPFNILDIRIEEEPQFYRGQEVLVRDNGEKWVPAHFAFIDKSDTLYPYVIFGGNSFEECIPLKDNENLIGTTDNP